MLQSFEGRLLCEAKIVPMACGHDAIEDQLRGAPEAVKTSHFYKIVVLCKNAFLHSTKPWFLVFCKAQAPWSNI